MVMEGDLMIDDHQNSLEMQEALDGAMKQVEIFQAAAAKVDERDFEGARELIEESEIPEETRARLVSALESGEWNLVDSVFSDYKARLGNAFCEGCWKDE